MNGNALTSQLFLAVVYKSIDKSGMLFWASALPASAASAASAAGWEDCTDPLENSGTLILVPCAELF